MNVEEKLRGLSIFDFATKKYAFKLAKYKPEELRESAEVTHEGLFTPEVGVRIVAGDLTVNGNIISHSAERDRLNLLAVTGDVRCEHFLLFEGSQVWVGGNLTVAGLCYTATPNASLQVSGNLRAAVIYSGNSNAWATVWGDVSAGALVNYVQNGKTGEKKEATVASPLATNEDLFSPELLDTSRWDKLDQASKANSDLRQRLRLVRPDSAKVLAALVKSKRVLRDSGR